MTHASIEQLTRSGERAVWLTSDGGWPIRCRTTRWSLVFAAAADGEPARRALAALYRAYFRPLHAFIARRHGDELATELTQAFFVQRWFEAGDLKRVRHRPGERFRGWLFKAMRNFLKNQWKYERRQCRDVTKTETWCPSDSADDTSRPAQLMAPHHDPERELGRARVLALLADVLAQLRREYCVRAAIAGVDGEHRFERIKDFLPCPSAGASDYAECAAALNVSVDAVKQAVTRQRARFTDLVEERLLQSGVSEADLPRAKRALCQALALPAPYAGAEHAAL